MKNAEKRRTRQDFGRSCSTGVVYWAIKHNFPDELRLLCHNCNFSLGAYGYCPHSNPVADSTAPRVLVNGGVINV